MTMNILIFSRATLNFIESLPLKDYEIVLDTVISGQSTFTVNESASSAKREDILIIHERSFFYIGIIKKIETEGLLTKITAFPFTSILDIEVICDSHQGNIGEHIVNLITNTLINSNDEKQNVPYLTVANESTATGAMTLEKPEIKTIAELIGEYNRLHGIRVEARLGIVRGLITHIKLVIAEVERTMKLRSDLALLRNLNINEDTDMPVNKVILRGEGLPTHEYYLLDDGTITADAINEARIIPVRIKYLTYQNSDDPLTVAKKELIKEKFAHAISFDIHVKNRIFVPFVNIKLGDEIDFIKGQAAYKTILSQIVYKGTLDECSVILGEHRIKLTEKLKLLERR